MKLDELFSIEKEEPIKMTMVDFVNKTRKILNKINQEYSSAIAWRRIEEHEYEQQDCDNCKGNCTIIRNGIEFNCVPDKSEGECFVLEFQYELFSDEIENIMFQDSNYSFYELLNCEIINDLQKIKEEKK